MNSIQSLLKMVVPQSIDKKLEDIENEVSATIPDIPALMCEALTGDGNPPVDDPNFSWDKYSEACDKVNLILGEVLKAGYILGSAQNAQTWSNMVATESPQTVAKLLTSDVWVRIEYLLMKAC